MAVGAGCSAERSDPALRASRGYGRVRCTAVSRRKERSGLLVSRRNQFASLECVRAVRRQWRVYFPQSATGGDDLGRRAIVARRRQGRIAEANEDSEIVYAWLAIEYSVDVTVVILQSIDLDSV